MSTKRPSGIRSIFGGDKPIPKEEISAEEVRKKREEDRGTVEKAEEMIQSYNPIRKIECPMCKELVPEFLIISIRGELKCIKCQINACRDYMEQNRRNFEEHVKQHVELKWDKK